MSLRTCSQGHETCWPDACPVCRAQRIPYFSTGRERQRAATKAYWKRYRAQQAERERAYTRAKLDRMGLR